MGGTTTRKIAILLLILGGCAAAAFLSYRLGWYRFSYPSTTRFPIQGIDVSHHQGPIDWRALGSQGVGFAFVKSSEGATFTDSRFASNWQGALAADIPWGPYHFFTFCTPGAAQAAHFRSVAGQASRQLPPVADIEFAGNCKNWNTLEAIRAELLIFLTLVEQDFGERPVLYVTSRAQRELLGGHFPAYSRWARRLLGEPSESQFGRWSFWQFADNARLPGISGPVDLNVYCCSAGQFPRSPSP